MTDAGEAYVKALANPEGPHALAMEWVGTGLARWFCLPTFETAIIQLQVSDEIPFTKKGKVIGRAAPGPAFVTRRVKGDSWGGMDWELQRLVNPEALSQLVVFDTWVQNRDRHLVGRKPNRNNVFLGTERVPRGRKRLYAMDHTHCFDTGTELTPRLAEKAPDERLYGLFPEFIPYLRRDVIEACRQRLRGFDREPMMELTGQLPREWEVPASAIGPWQDLVFRRARFVADTMIDRLLAQCH